MPTPPSVPLGTAIGISFINAEMCLKSPCRGVLNSPGQECVCLCVCPCTFVRVCVRAVSGKLREIYMEYTGLLASPFHCMGQVYLTYCFACLGWH